MTDKIKMSDVIYANSLGDWFYDYDGHRDKYHHDRIVEALRKERDMNAQHIGELAEFIKNSGVNTDGVDLSAPAQYLCSEIAKIQIAELKAKLENTVYELASCKGHNEELKANMDKAKWQPIETAPKDGTMILVCLPRIMNLVIRARYNTIHNHWMDENYIDKDGKDNRGVSRFAYYHDGDLWCPIPDAPEQR